MQVEKIWVIKVGSKFVALDDSSGGYPYETEFWNCKKFRSLRDAVSYSSIGINKNGWEIYACDEVGILFEQPVRGKQDMYEIELAELKTKYGQT